MKAQYTEHHKDDAQGHVFLGEKNGAVVVNLTGAVAMTQEELNFYGHLLADAINNMTPEQREVANRLAQKTRAIQPGFLDQ